MPESVSQGDGSRFLLCYAHAQLGSHAQLPSFLPISSRISCTQVPTVHGGVCAFVQPKDKPEASEHQGTPTPEAHAVKAAMLSSLNPNENTVHASQPISTFPEGAPAELADRTNRMSAQPACRSSTGKVWENFVYFTYHYHYLTHHLHILFTLKASGGEVS